MGDLSDIIGRRKVLMFCMGGFFIGFSMMGLGVELRSLLVLFVGRSLTGISAASLPTALATIADLSTSETKAKNMSYVVFVQCIGFIFGPLMGGILSGSKKHPILGEALPFFAAGLLALLAFSTIVILFRESFQSGKKKFYLLRVFLVFKEAAKHPRIRNLTAAFMLHQLGIGLFTQLILVYLQRAFGYTTFGMGIYNSFLGVWMALALLLIPFLSRKYPIEKVTCASLAIAGFTNLTFSFVTGEWLIWALLIPFGMSAILAWSSILTSFSHAVGVESQGWALGIKGAVVDFAFMFTGFSPNLVPYFGVMPIIALSGVFLLISSLIMGNYCKKYISNCGRKG